MSPEQLAIEPRQRSHIARRSHRPGLRLGLLTLLAAAACAAYLTIGVRGNWVFILERRALTLATMVVVGVAIAVSTVVFHTVATNQILTPSIMGFDALYLLIQTVGVMSLGVAGSVAVDPLLSFGVEVTLMVVMSVALYRWLLVGLRRSLHLLVLIGIVIGGLFRSVSAFLQRIMDPTAFAVLQDRFFADFSGADPRLLLVGGLVVAGLTALVWRRRATLDVLALGRESATSLGVDHRRHLVGVLVVVALLVSVSTALVGPTSFFGLLVAHLAYQLLSTHRHAWTLPGAALAAVVCLVGGQVVFERVLGFEGSLSMVVEALGGIVFIVLLLRRSRA